MHFEVRLDKAASSKIYIRDVINSSRTPWLLQHVGKNIDKETLDAAKDLSAPLYFSLITPEDLEAYVSKFKFVFDRLLALHDNYWSDNLVNLHEVNNMLKKIMADYGEAIAEEICLHTGTEWSTNKIVICPAAYIGGTVQRNEVYVGVNNKAEDDCIGVLIHELVHINTDEEYERLQNQFKSGEAAKEITATLITNKVIDSLNNRFNLNYNYQEISAEQKKEFGKIYKELDARTKNANTFKSMLTEIDKAIYSN